MVTRRTMATGNDEALAIAKDHCIHAEVRAEEEGRECWQALPTSFSLHCNFVLQSLLVWHCDQLDRSPSFQG
jgi:hypothetical protein